MKDEYKLSSYGYEDITNEETESRLCVDEEPNDTEGMKNDSFDWARTVLTGCSSDSEDTDEVKVDARGVQNFPSSLVLSSTS